MSMPVSLLSFRTAYRGQEEDLVGKDYWLEFYFLNFPTGKGLFFFSCESGNKLTSGISLVILENTDFCSAKPESKKVRDLFRNKDVIGAGN